MPYPAQTDRERIILKAREMIEAEGFDQLSLAKLANAFGIKAPSLYRHVASKNDLLREVNLVTTQELVETIKAAIMDEATPQKRWLALCHAYRAFARQYPATYQLMMNPPAEETRPDAAQLEQMVLPLQGIMAEIAGEADAVHALRGAMALVHGFIMLELNTMFRRAFDIDESFQQTVEAYIKGWQSAQPGDRA